MQKGLLLVAFWMATFFAFSQQSTSTFFAKDSVIIIAKNPDKGFYHNYILFLPKGIQQNKKLYLLVEPNNTGKINDSIEVHQKAAVNLASVSSVGNNIATELHIPLLVPVFPRPASKPYTYTHALDRDVMEEKSKELKRLDLQLVAMIKDAQAFLETRKILIADKFFMCGFSASASFTNRFSFLHPEKIQALAIGGFNGELMLPEKYIHKTSLNYPLGTNDFEKLFKRSFNKSAYLAIPQFIYMGAQDENDAVQFDDAYSNSERKIINQHKGATVQERYLKCQQHYLQQKVSAGFKTYEKVGHWTNSAINLEVILFFMAQLKTN